MPVALSVLKEPAEIINIGPGLCEDGLQILLHRQLMCSSILY
jgi:hypothetical protein